MKKGEERNSCFVASTHSQSPFMRLAFATGRPGDSSATFPLWVATRASTASAISWRCFRP
jgi:hypothetical protein